MIILDITAKEYFHDAYRVLFVATSEPRHLYISNVEESQIGNVYRRALDLGGKLINMLING